MNASQLATLVKLMRDAQRTYFRARTSENLSSAKALESQVDTAVAHVLAGPSLFEDSPPRRERDDVHGELGGEG